jgi:hypothetical protein
MADLVIGAISAARRESSGLFSSAASSGASEAAEEAAPEPAPAAAAEAAKQPGAAAEAAAVAAQDSAAQLCPTPTAAAEAAAAAATAPPGVPATFDAIRCERVCGSGQAVLVCECRHTAITSEAPEDPEVAAMVEVGSVAFLHVRRSLLGRLDGAAGEGAVHSSKTVSGAWSYSNIFCPHHPPPWTSR